MKHDFFQVANDVADPSGTGLKGSALGVNLTKTAYGQPAIFFAGPGMDLFLTVEVYRQEGAPDWVHMKCPRCANALKISADRKEIDYERDRVPPWKKFNATDIMNGLGLEHHGGTLSISPFRCDWPYDGFVCGFTASITKNEMKSE